MYNYDVGTQNILPKYSSIIILGVDGSFLHFEHKMNNRQHVWKTQSCEKDIISATNIWFAGILKSNNNIKSVILFL